MNEAKSESTPINMSSILSPSVAQYLHPDYLQPLPTTVSTRFCYDKLQNKCPLFLSHQYNCKLLMLKLIWIRKQEKNSKL